MQPDVIEQFGSSLIQHGEYNDRIYVMKLARKDADALPEALLDFARAQGYSKVFAKLPAEAKAAFAKAGYHVEARIPDFFKGEEEAFFMSRFLDADRRESNSIDANQRVLDICYSKREALPTLDMPEGAELEVCDFENAETIATLYSDVFPTYPFPIDDPDYIRQTMDSHVVYFGIRQEDELVALSSSEMDPAARNVEMTDFATRPEHRGDSLATVLLDAMEEEMSRRKMATAYTIARATSVGMNITFARMGYAFGGRLVNNTNIGGQLEDMNVWYKPLERDGTS